MALEALVGRLSEIGYRVKKCAAKIALAAGLAGSVFLGGCYYGDDEDIPPNPTPVVYAYLNNEARTDKDTYISAFTYDADLADVVLYYKIGNGPEYMKIMDYYGDREFMEHIPRPAVNDLFLRYPADYVYFKVVAYDSAGSSAADPPSGYYAAKLYASEGHGRDAIWFVLDSAEAQGYFYPMTYFSESEWASLYTGSGSFEADVDVMDSYIDDWWYSPYFGFEYLLDGDYESERIPISSSGYTPSEISFIQSRLMSWPSIGPPAVWLIDKGTISEVEDAVWDGLFFAKYMAGPPYY